jgi:HPt (histidine-containing phosphotransfer) domain-containing protein
MTDTSKIIDCEQVRESKDILGDKFSVIVENFIKDSEDHLLEMSVCRGGGQDIEVGHYSHQLKSSAFQVGAIRVSSVAMAIDDLIRENSDNIHDMAVQTRLDFLIDTLQSALQDYKIAIRDYL